MPQLPDIHTWNEDSLKTLPGGEVSYIEYKDSRWLTLDEKWRQDISTYLSAFANYDGGYLIIGMSDPVKTGTAKLGAGVPDNLKGGIVQWLQNVLPGLVERPLDRIDVWPIGPKTSESPLHPGHSALVIHVPASEGAPHQARDGKYYTRHGSRLYKLGHQAIVDILGRRKHPFVKMLQIQLTWTKRDEFFLWVEVENTSSVLARFWSVVVDFPIYVGENVVLTHKNDPFATTADGLTATRVNLNYANSPLFPLSKRSLSEPLEGSPRVVDSRTTTGLEDVQTISDVRFKVFADNMPFIEGTLPIEKVLVRL